jgi:hypothetical protein
VKYMFMNFFGLPRQVLEQLKLRHERLLSHPYRLVSKGWVTDQPPDMILMCHSDPSYNVRVGSSDKGVLSKPRCAKFV